MTNMLDSTPASNTEAKREATNLQAIDLKAVLFDLDGTLVDTAKDFVRIIHELAVENQWTAPDEQTIREQVSAGSQAMVSLFKMGNKSLTEDKIQQLKQQFLSRYDADICVDSCLFEGLDALLDILDAAQIPWGVVTNKPRYLSEKLLEKLNLNERCHTLVCPDDVTHPKPHPEPMYQAMQAMQLEASLCPQVLYIGDHIRDIQAGNHANMKTIVASYGYISTDELTNISNWDADYIVNSSAELVSLIQSCLAK